MFKRFGTTVALSAILAGLGALAASPADIQKLKYPPLGEIVIPEVERVELPNGMVLMMVEDHELPLVHFRAMVRAGTIYEPKGEAALTDIFDETMRTGGTKSMTGDEMDEVLEQIGASVETSLGTTSGSVTGRCLREHVDTVLPIFADVLMHPEFRQDKIDLAKTQLRSQIARRNDNVFGILFREYQKLLYGKDSPYARQVEYEDVDRLTREDLLEFHGRFYHPNAVILGVWGDFDKGVMKEKIEKAFASWPKTPIDYPPRPEGPKTVPKGIHYVEKTDIEQAFIMIGHLSVQWDHPDLPKIQVMNTILGSGSTSRIFRTVRTEKGLAYAAGGSISPRYDFPGYFYTFCSTKFATTHEALTTMLDVVRDFRKAEATERELTTAKDGYLNSFAFKFDSTGEVLNRLMTYEYFGYPQDFLQDFRKKLENVTTADVLEVAKRHIHPDDLVILVVGDKSRFDRQLTELGQVATIDITIPEPRSQERVAGATPESLARGKKLTDRAIEKLGGSGKVTGLKSMTLKTSVTMILPQGEFEVQGTQTILFPDRIHMEMVTPMGPITQVLDGDTGWSRTPRGVSPLPAPQAAEMKKEARFGWVPLLQSLARGEVQAQSLGRIPFEERQAEDLYLRFPDGTTAHLYMDPTEFTLLGIRRMGSTPSGPAEIVQLLDDFRDLGPVKVPFSITTKSGDQVIQKIRISEAELNPAVDAEIFSKPED